VAGQRKRFKNLEEFRKHTLGWLLLRLGQDFRQRASAEWRERGYEGIQNAHASVIEHLPLEGARITGLAQRAGVTKQAMGQLVDELEELGFVERIPDASDNRAKIVRFTEMGLSFLNDAREIVAKIWWEYAELLGEARLTRVHVGLDALLERIEKEIEASR
jgi:DNA-binding MarR family transcriptional regulator